MLHPASNRPSSAASLCWTASQGRCPPCSLCTRWLAVAACNGPTVARSFLKASVKWRKASATGRTATFMRRACRSCAGAEVPDRPEPRTSSHATDRQAGFLKCIPTRRGLRSNWSKLFVESIGPILAPRPARQDESAPLRDSRWPSLVRPVSRTPLHARVGSVQHSRSAARGAPSGRPLDDRRTAR